jgi:hypothetical protein
MQAVLSVATLPLRGYLTELILEQLSYFIRKDCLNVDQLTLGGNLVLYNLELRLDVLRETLGVPLTFDISRGFIKKLSVTIPWTSLFGQPIEVLIDTILIVIRSKTEAEMKHTAHTTCQTGTRKSSNGNVNSDSTNGHDSHNNNSKNGYSNNENTEPIGVAGIADDWTRAVLTKILANTYITIRDLIFKYEAPSGPTVMVTLRTFKCFSTSGNKDGNRWSEPEGDERFVEKVAVIDDLSVSLSRYDHALRGSNDKPIISRATISARARFALNPLPRDVVDYTIDETSNPFGPHLYVEIFVPFLEASITQTQVEMMELIQYRAIQSEKELAMYVVEATAAAELQAKLLEEARAREAKEREERRRKENLLNGGTGASDDLNSSINIDLTNIDTYNNEEDDGNDRMDESYSGGNANNSTWSQWAWDVLLGEDDVLDGSPEVSDDASIGNANYYHDGDSNSKTKYGLSSKHKTQIGKGANGHSNENYHNNSNNNLKGKNKKKSSATYTLVEICADHIALSLLLQEDTTCNTFTKRNIFQTTNAKSSIKRNSRRKAVTPLANNSGMLASDRLNLKLLHIEHRTVSNTNFKTPPQHGLVQANGGKPSNSNKRKMQVPTPRGIVEIEYDDDDDDRKRHNSQLALLPIATFVFSSLNAQVRSSNSESIEKSVVNILLDLGSFVATDGKPDSVNSFIVWGGRRANDSINAFHAVKNRSRSLSDTTPPPSPRIFNSRRKERLNSTSSIFNTIEQPKAALSSGKLNIYEEQISFEGEMGDIELLVSPEPLSRLMEFSKACKNIKIDDNGEDATVTSTDDDNDKKLQQGDGNVVSNVKKVKKEKELDRNDTEAEENDDKNVEETRKKNMICFATLNSFSISLFDKENGNEIMHGAMQDFHLHFGKKSASIMVNRFQMDLQPGVVFLLIENPGLGLNIVYEGVGVETVMLDVGKIIVNAKGSMINSFMETVAVNLDALYSSNKHVKNEKYNTGFVEDGNNNDMISSVDIKDVTNDNYNSLVDENKKRNTPFEKPSDNTSNQVDIKKWYYPSIGSVEVSKIQMHVSTSGVTGASVEFAPVRLSNIRRSSRIMLEELWAHYAADALLAVPGLFGSLDIFGNPAGVMRELSDALQALGEGKGATAVKGASGAFLIPMERISRSIKNAAEGISFGPASGFVIAPIRKLAEAFEGFATGGREVLGVSQTLPSIMRQLKCAKTSNATRSVFNDEELRGMPMLTV